MSPMPLWLLVALAVCTVAYGSPLVIPASALDPGAKCAPLTDPICSSDYAPLAVGASIYLNATTTQADLVTALSAVLARTEVIKTLAPSCYVELRKFICLGYLSLCTSYNTSTSLGTVALRIAPCYNSCVAMQAVCAAPFQSFGIPLPTCPPEPVTYDFTQYGGDNFTDTCTDFYSGGAKADISCPLSVVFWGNERPNRLRKLIIGFGYVAFVLCVLATALTAMNSKLRRWPAGLVIVLGVAQSMMAWGCIMQSFASLEGLHCEYKHLCRAQAFFIAAGLHFAITSWMLVTIVTMLSVWSSNPKANLKWTSKQGRYFALVYIIPLAFTIYVCTDLGSSSVGILCATSTVAAQEQGLVWPLAAEVFIGTCCWIAAVFRTIWTFKDSPLSKRDLLIYGRLLLYEFFAIAPSALFIIPFEVYRDNIGLASDHHFIHDQLWASVQCSSIAAFLCPMLFGVIFLLRGEHFIFVGKLWRKTMDKTSTYSSSRSARTTEVGTSLQVRQSESISTL